MIAGNENQTRFLKTQEINFMTLWDLIKDSIKIVKEGKPSFFHIIPLLLVVVVVEGKQ